MSRHLRILFLSWRDQHHPEAGGAEKYLVEVAEGLARRGHQVTVRTAAYPGAIRDEVVHGVAYSRRGGRFGVFPRALASRLAGRLRADVVVDIQNGVPFLSPLAGGRVINLVHHVHREQWPVVVGKKAAGIGWWLESEVAPRVYRKVPYVVVSPSTGRELTGLGVDADRMSVIYNGTDVVKLEHIERSATPQIIVLGRLVPHKRVELAIDALALLAPAHPDLSMLVVGSGWWGHRLEEYAESAGVRDRITFTDHVSEAEKHRLLAQAWVQALPSLKEGWGLVVVEAGVHGTPTVGFYEAGGVQDSIRDGETGLLCEEGAPALAVALGRIIDDAELRERLSRQVQDWVAQFRWDQTVDVWERLLIGADEGAAAEDVDGSSPEPEFGHNKTHGP